MSENNQEVEEAQPETIAVATPGQLLKEGREAAKLSVDDISKKLHLKAALISAIEENNFDEITSITFARGYLRAYAKILHANEDEILAAFEHYTTTEQQQLEMQTFSNRKGKKTLDSWLTILTLLLVVGIVGAVVVWYMRNQPIIETPASTTVDQPQLSTSNQAAVKEPPPVDDNLSPAGELLEPETEPENKPDNEQPELDNEQPELDSAQPERQTQLQTQSEVQQPEQQLTESQTDAVLTNSNEQSDTQISEQNSQDAAPVAHLELRFEDDCWINIQDATGERIAIGTKVKGHYTSVHGVPPFTIKLGKPDVVSIWLDDQSRKIPYYPKGSIANFELAAN